MDRQHDIAIFKALVDKIPEIKESVVKCALYQDRIEELRIILNSGKMESLNPIELFGGAKSEQTRNLFISFYPNQTFQKPLPKKEPHYIKYDGSLSDAELRVIQFNKLCDSLSTKAVQAASKREFETARVSCDAIPDEKVREKIAIELFDICFKFGGFEALECPIKIAKMQKNHLRRDIHLCHLIDVCLKLQDKEVANSVIPLALKEITDYYTHKQYKQKSGFFLYMTKLPLLWKG